MMKTNKSSKELEQCKSPTEKDVQEYMKLNKETYYVSREALRNRAYGGTPPNGYSSWGDYWKSY